MTPAAPKSGGWAGVWVVGCVLALLLGSAAHAAPPLPGTEDYELMAPYAYWVQSVHDQDGRWCCDVADGRPVEARMFCDASGSSTCAIVWQAFISRAKFGDSAPDAWVDVPERAVRRIANPIGQPIAWWYAGEIRCFVPGDGI